MLQTTNLTAASTAFDQLTAQLSSCHAFPALVSVPLEAVEPLAWLAGQKSQVKLVWAERGRKSVTVGTGEAASVTAKPGAPAGDVPGRCRQIIGGHETLRFYGGFSFDGSDGWAEFGAGRFWLPRFLLQDGHLHAVVLDRDDIVAATLDIQRLNLSTSPSDDSLPHPVDAVYRPDRDRWRTNVNEALDLVRREVLEKVVLARETTMTFSEPVDPVQLTSRIARSTHGCFVFCFQLGPQLAFVGATPERLFKRQGRRLLSEILAGTRPRGQSVGEDQRLAYDLLMSDKDQLEHDIVRKCIRQKLHQFVDQLDVDSHASVVRLARKQHLCSDVEATLKAGVTDGQLLDRLHPTPAVGGYPTENALPEIARLEPFNRGWYAAPVGWIGRDEAEFVVGIRSGLLKGRQLKLYSGAGIVTGSEPDQEWAEIENKICDFVSVLGS